LDLPPLTAEKKLPPCGVQRLFAARLSCPLPMEVLRHSDENRRLAWPFPRSTSPGRVPRFLRGFFAFGGNSTKSAARLFLSLAVTLGYDIGTRAVQESRCPGPTEAATSPQHATARSGVCLPRDASRMRGKALSAEQMRLLLDYTTQSTSCKSVPVARPEHGRRHFFPLFRENRGPVSPVRPPSN